MTKLNMQVVFTEADVKRIIAQYVRDELDRGNDDVTILANSVEIEILTDCPRIKQVTVQVR